MRYRQLLILKNELATDPLGRGYSGMSQDQKLVSLNNADRDVPATVSTDQVLQYMTTAATNPGGGVESTVSLLREAADEGTVQGGAITAQQKSSCIMIWEALKHGRGVVFDVEDSIIVAAFQNARDAGVFTNPQLSEIQDMATAYISRAVELGLGVVVARNIVVAENI